MLTRSGVKLKMPIRSGLLICYFHNSFEVDVKKMLSMMVGIVHIVELGCKVDP